MQQIKRKRWISILLSVMMVVSMFNVPSYAADDEITLLDNITPESTNVTVNLSQAPSSGVLFILQLDANDTYRFNEINSYTKLYFGVIDTASLNVGENNLTLTQAPTAGKKIIAVVRDTSSGSDIKEYISNAVTVKDSSSTQTKTPEEILANSTVQLMKDGAMRSDSFREGDTSVDVKVQLDDTLQDCHLTIFAYAGNTAFDPDASQNIRLWSGKVINGDTTCNFSTSNLPLKVGYKIVACLNVPVGTDGSGDTYYRSSISQALEVVDENGQGFKDYDPYPNVSIDETTLEESATSLHISLVGDQRLFQAAAEGKTKIVCSVAQYPDGEDFDFESSDQIPLASNMEATEAFTDKEITLSQPLRAGYRVRAVVYWEQNPEIFLVKGNDYEAVFGQPDDSVLVTGSSQQHTPTAVINGEIFANAKSVSVTVAGDIPDGATLLLKSYDSGTTEFAMNDGSWVGSAFDLTAGTYTVTPQSGSLSGDKKLVAFVQKSGTIVAQSAPVIIQTPKPFTITTEDDLTTESTQVIFQVTANDSSIHNINMAKLCKVKAGGEADTSAPIDTQYGQKPGSISFNITAGSLSAGDKVCLVLTYDNGDAVYTSESFTVTAPLAQDSLAIRETEFTTESTFATVVVSGCDKFKGGYLILTTGPENISDADSRTQVGSVSFTGEGTYNFNLSRANLKAGETILPHLYKYDMDQDTTMYQYGDPVVIKSTEGQTVPSKVEIVTDNITQDRKDLWATVNFDSSLTGTLKLYTYIGDAFDVSTATEIYSATVSPSENSQRITFGTGKLTEGQNLVAVLGLSDGSSVQSPFKVIQAAPQKDEPVAKILDNQITAGDTYLKASLTFDTSANNASYMLYQFMEDELDMSKATLLSSGSIYRSDTNKSIYLGSGKLVIGAKLQLVLTADGMEAKSNVVTVEPSPDWGTPYAAFDVSAVKADADSIPVTIDYSGEYLSLGDAFYCDVTVYQFSARYTDQEFEDNELWENSYLVTRVGQVNSNNGAVTKGQISVPIRDGVTLNPGDRLIIKLRLPHTEWDGEEVDYVSVSVPVIGADDQVPDYKVVLYNLGEDSSRGNRLRKILNDLGIPTETLEYTQLNESVGYLAGLDGYEAAKETYDGESYSTEFMLMCNLPESLLDRFLDAMTDSGLRIDHKAVVTEYNREYLFYELIGDIEEEHDVFQALLTLSKMVEEAEKLSEDDYGHSPHWTDCQTALTNADNVLRSYEPTLEQLETAYVELKTQYLAVTDMSEMTGYPVITITKDSNGNYTLTAEVKNGSDGADYLFTWSNGETGKTIFDIPEDKLIGTTVEVTGANMFGKLTAQLQVPDAPLATVEARSNEIEVSWTPATKKDNQPMPTEYVVSIYKGDKLVKTEQVDGIKTFMAMSGLEADTQYTVKIHALSPVGRSDVVTITATTAKSGNGNSNIEKPVDPQTNPHPTPGENPDSEAKPAPGGNTNQGIKPATSTNVKHTDNITTPKTGDDSAPILWTLVLMIASVGMVTMAATSKKKGKIRI